MLFGKDCGCCIDAAKYMNLEVIPGPAAGQSTIGGIQKEHFGVINECFSMADKYNFDFPSDNIDEQAIFLSAIQFIDMMFFEMNYWGVGSI
jgi:hypothetical protein